MDTNQNHAAGCEEYPAKRCSKSESATPLTDALFAKCKARPTDGSGSRDGGWGQQDIADFLRHSRKLEIALGVTTSSLREIAEAQGDQSISLDVRGFELVGRMQGIASVALNASTLNPTGQTVPPRNRQKGLIMEPTQESATTCGASSAPGCWAIFHGVGGYPVENIQARTNLKIGGRYRVIGGSMGQSRTVIELEGVRGSWNSVLFDIEGELPVQNTYRPNPRADRAAHLVRGTVEPVVGCPNGLEEQ